MVKVYMDYNHPNAFVDFPSVPECPDYMNGASLCPMCKGHGGWNLELNAYSLHQNENTPENRHKFSHFRSNCSQCNGYGWTDDVSCLHEYQHVRCLAPFEHESRCIKCDKRIVYDTSG